MLCEKCNKNQATVYYKNSMNGNVSEGRLCSECANTLYFGGGGFNFNAGEFFVPNVFSEALNSIPQIFPQEQRVCPLCGSVFGEIAKKGKAGCGECYSVYSREFIPGIENMHGKIRHIGKIPARAGAALSKKKKIETLNKKLNDMIKIQNFEEAAKIRDEIRALNNSQSV